MKKRFVFISLTVVFMLLICFVVSQINFPVKFAGDIISFKYEYGSGFGKYYKYKLLQTDEGIRFTGSGHYGMYEIEDATVNTLLLDDSLTQLKDVIIENEISDWNGFNEQDITITDGCSFTLYIVFERGEIQAHGYERYPENYSRGDIALRNYIEKLMEKSN